MDLIDLIAGAQGGRGLENIGQQFGLSPTQTRAAVEALAPVVAAGLSRNASSNDGLADLLSAVLGGNHGRYVEDASATRYDAVVDDGNAILGHVFGSKDVSRGVAMKAGELSGVGSAVLKKMLPVIAAMVMGAISKRMFGNSSSSRSGPGGLGDILSDLLGGAASSAPQRQQAPSGGLDDMLKEILGGGAGGGVTPRGGQAGQPDLDAILREILGGGAASGQSRIPRPVQEEAARRGRERLDDVLGRRSGTGNAADDLLNSVQEAILRR
jgi:hypothetical protein